MRLPTIHQGVNRRNVEYFAENRGCYAFQENFGRTFEHPNLIHASYSLLVDFTSSEENSLKKKTCQISDLKCTSVGYKLLLLKSG